MSEFVDLKIQRCKFSSIEISDACDIHIKRYPGHNNWQFRSNRKNANERSGKENLDEKRLCLFCRLRWILQTYSVTFNANFVIIITSLRSFFTMMKKLRSNVIMIRKFMLRITE